MLIFIYFSFLFNSYLFNFQFTSVSTLSIKSNDRWTSPWKKVSKMSHPSRAKTAYKSCRRDARSELRNAAFCAVSNIPKWFVFLAARDGDTSKFVRAKSMSYVMFLVNVASASDVIASNLAAAAWIMNASACLYPVLILR